MSADRELHAHVVVPASPAQVWDVLIDFTRMPEWSPELVKMVPLKPGGLRLGQWYLGVNRRGLVVWPTRNVISVLDPGRCVAWDTRSSGARWSYDLAEDSDGTRVTLTRPVPVRLTRLSRIVAPMLLGGSEEHADELERGMQTTLERLRAAVPTVG
jgi:uncharacterized protein YndB with AHSA1/START domain